VNPQLTVMTLIRGGVFTRADARACGYLDPDIDSLLDSGGWRRIRPGTYAPGRLFAVVNEEMLHLRRLYHLLRYGEPGLAASHQSAAALHALPLWGLDLSSVHVTATEGRPGRHAGGVRRHVRDPVGPGIQSWNGLRLSSPARAVAEVAATSAFAPAVVLAEAALYAGMVTPGSLKRAVNQLAVRRSGLEQARAVLGRAGSHSASVAESRLRLILAEAGLPAPSASSPPMLDEYAVDLESCALWFEEQRAVVEFEPREPYWSDEYDDYQGELAAQTFGAPSRGEPAGPPPQEYCWISWADLDHPDLVVDRIRTAFGRAASRTGVRPFDPHRRRSGRRRPGLLPSPHNHDLPC
jgi:Transcriptional regulator, AbiEi antitoxin